ncbi:protein grainyhead-like isoform X3 [Daphnia pulicaria]|uniref:protein grainyhead-like isoform X3 n=1 Tax=Daphnia pulicaria TaxID=35523 RepID=UPI001EEBFCF8|nr:protein grainyhead-like isoform X3 [Daphnia pulicaria]
MEGSADQSDEMAAPPITRASSSHDPTSAATAEASAGYSGYSSVNGTDPDQNADTAAAAAAAAAAGFDSQLAPLHPAHRQSAIAQHQPSVASPKHGDDNREAEDNFPAEDSQAPAAGAADPADRPQLMPQILRPSVKSGGLKSGSRSRSSSPSRASPSSPSSPSVTRIRMSSAAETLGAVGGGSGSSGAGGAATPAGENEDAAWRNTFYEHPLHAATNAMLHLGGGNALNEDSSVNSVGSVLVSYEHHYYPSKSQHHHQPHQHHSLINSLPVSSSVQPGHKDGKSMNDLWPRSGMGGSHSSSADGLSSGKEIGGQQNHQSHEQATSEPDIYPLAIKKEPEDLTRRNLRHALHHPDSRIVCSSSNDNNKVDSGGGGVSGTVISRVLADGELVHEMIPRLESISHVMSGGVNDGSREGGANPSGSVIHIRRPISSQPSHDGDSMMSPAALDLARAGIQSALQQQYSPSAYSSNSGAVGNGHQQSGLASIQVVNNHGYDSSPGPAYGLVSPNEPGVYTAIHPSSTLRQQPSGYAVSSSVGSSDSFYRDYFTSSASNNSNANANSSSNGDQQYARAVAQLAYGEGHESAFGDRFIRSSNNQPGVYKQQQQQQQGTGLTVDLPSPDSGIGVDAVTPRDQSVAQQNFDYTEYPGLIGEPAIEHPSSEQQHHNSAHGGSDEGSRTPTSGDCNRQSEVDKIQIPKVFNQYGFRYYLESPISTSQRREDDRITYINKGQFYGITLEYVPDPERPLKNQTVKTMVMLVFREEKSPEDEAKAWQFWHGRQHSAKQRILDADTKNSSGLIGCIEEVAHNAICIYWNPLESSAKINVAVQCLSTDFSSQKGVKGLPLHLQIDTFDDPRDSIPVFHRGYCQVKVFCDKGAERKTRDEERRAAKRKMVVTGRNKRLEELYHLNAERSEFYHMADLMKPPTLFTPDDHEKLGAPMELPSFYGQDHERKEFLDTHTSLIGTPAIATSGNIATLYSSPASKRRKLTPPPCERVMIYVRQENELAFTPLHLVPPTSLGLLDAIESKYKLSASTINMLYRKNAKGILAKIDDDMLKHYCNEDLFILEITTSSEEGMYDITLKELYDT